MGAGGLAAPHTNGRWPPSARVGPRRGTSASQVAPYSAPAKRESLSVLRVIKCARAVERDIRRMTRRVRVLVPVALGAWVALAAGCDTDVDDASGTESSDAGHHARPNPSDGGTASRDSSDGASILDCADRECGSDHALGSFCGNACSRGEGCSARGECGPWPPDLDSVYDGAEGWRLPSCDHGDEPGADLATAHEVRWIKTMTTKATDCPEVIQKSHPMARPGNVVAEDQRVFVNGSCVEYGLGEHWGTAYQGVIVWGQSWPSRFEHVQYTINWRALIDHNLDPPSGKGVAHLTGLTGLDCEIEMDVTYEKCPEHRKDCGFYPTPY